MQRALFILLIFISTAAFGQNGYTCFNQSEQKANWQFLGPMNPDDKLADQHFGVIICMSINPKDSNEIYAGAMSSGLFHTTNRGKSWQCLTDDVDLPIIGVKDIMVNYAQSPHEIMITTGDGNDLFSAPTFGIFSSVNGGKTWTRKLNKPGLIFTPSILEFIETKDMIIGRGLSCFYTSKNNGASWEPLIDEKRKIGGVELKERNIYSAYFDQAHNKLYFSTSQKYISTGAEHAQLYCYDFSTTEIINLTPRLKKSYDNPPGKNDKIAIQLFKKNDKELNIAANFSKAEEMVIYTFNLKQQKITDFEVPSNRLGAEDLKWFRGFVRNNKNDQVIYLGGRTLLKSTNGGQDFKNLYHYSYGRNNVPHADVRFIKITKHSEDGESDHIYLGTDGGISFSTDGGKSFRNLNGRSLPVTQFYGVGSSPFSGIISGGTQDNSIFTYVPKTKQWLQSRRGDGYDVAYTKYKPGLAYGQYNARLLMLTHTDKVPFDNSAKFGTSEASSNCKTLLTHKNGNLYFADRNLNVLVKGSKKWQKYPMPLQHEAIAFDVSETDPNIIFSSGKWGDLIKSTDGGKSWTNLNKKLIVDGQGFHEMRFRSICISPYDPNRIWIGFGMFGDYRDLCKETYQVLTSKDGGATWQNDSQGLPIFVVQDLKFFKGTYNALFMACAQGVYYKKGDGYKWERFSDNLPQCLISELNINYCRGKLIASTFGRGLWETDLPKVKHKNAEIIRKKKVLSAPQGEALFMDRDIILKKRAALVIDCPVHMPKGSRILVKNKKQVIVTENGKLLNECGEKWEGITTK